MEHADIKVHGIVQGVGFRPFIHKQVRFLKLTGYIKNTSSGVELELEGEKKDLQEFINTLPERAPKLAVIEKVEYNFSDKLKNFNGFEIKQSKTEAFRNTLISPDICICEDCLWELKNPFDRRYRYPFINCTNCGPRFTIIKDVPYDRAKTSMSAFPMCDACDREYHDIENRRYHAQPDCCSDCGPHVFFMDAEGREVPGDAIENARKLIKNGFIVAVKGLGGIHLACRADSPETALGLRHRKQRDEKPFALMCRDTESAEKICDISDDERRILESPQRPIVLLRKKEKGLWHISENNSVGVMLPYTPLHYLLFGEDIEALIMTSANISDTPIMYDNIQALEQLRGIADGFLLHNRDIQTRCDDSLCRVYEGREYFIRRSRGYVPFPIKREINMGMLLACGAEQKASFSLSKDDYVFPCQHIGDLKNLETLSLYEAQISHFERLFDIAPRAIACDLHPDYMSSEYAEKRAKAEKIPLLKIQHHHAHMASCMADNSISGDVIGIIWDGTGLGTDGTSWGGEFLTGGFESFERVGHIRPIKLIGGDKAAEEISRTAFYMLKDSGCDTESIENSELYSRMLEADINCPVSTGMGRLFDGVASIIGIKSTCSYEGQGAILLEAAAAEGITDTYTVSIKDKVFDWRNMVREIYSDLQHSAGKDVISAKFMNTIIHMAVLICRDIREEKGLNRVCLSGGTFQNMYILRRLPKALKESGFEVYTHRRVSCNDEGLSLGQIAILNEVYNVSGNSIKNY